MAQLEALEAVARLSLLTDDIEDGVDELSALGVVSLGPVVTGTALTEHEVVRTEDLTEGTSPHAVHGAWLEIDEHSSGHVLASGGLVVVDIDALELEIGVAVVGAGRIDAVLIGDDLPELKRTETLYVRTRYASIAYTFGFEV